MKQPIPLRSLIEAVRGTAVDVDVDRLFHGLSLDSRLVRPGEVFWAFSGTQQDGHDFVPQALERGAVACVVRNDYLARQTAKSGFGPLIGVEETGAALAAFGQWNRRRSEALIIGVTGSVGKTTTRNMIHCLLSERFSGIRNQNNFNNEIGLPLTLVDLSPEDEFAVLEMGARHAGDIAQLCVWSQPEVGVVTRIAPAHLETFGSLEAIRQGKGELLRALPQNGFAVIGGDDPLTRSMAELAPCRVIHVGFEPGNDVRAERLESAEELSRFRVDGTLYEVRGVGQHHVQGALFAIAIGQEFGLCPGEMVQGLSQFQPIPGRSRVEKYGSWTVINDCYNSNPVSMLAACETLRNWRGTGKKFLIVGDMLELGQDSTFYHREVGKRGTLGVDRLLTLGSQAQAVVDGAVDAGMRCHQIGTFSEVEPLCSILDCWLEPGDTILVKGSRGMRMERIIEWLRTHVPESESTQRVDRGRGSQVRAVA